MMLKPSLVAHSVTGSPVRRSEGLSRPAQHVRAIVGCRCRRCHRNLLRQALQADRKLLPRFINRHYGGRGILLPGL